MKRFIAELAGLVVILYGSQGEGAILMGSWKFEEGSGTVAIDNSGNGFNGNIYGSPTWVEDGRSGLGLHFDGVDDYIEIPNTSGWNFSSGFTLIASVRYYDDQPGNDGFVISKHIGGIRSGYGLGVTGLQDPPRANRLFLMTQPGVDIDYGKFWAGNYKDGDWHDVMAVYDGQSLASLYVKDASSNWEWQLAATKDPCGYTSFNDVNIRIGACLIGPGPYGPGDGPLSLFHGDIDEVQIYSGAIPEPSTFVVFVGLGAISLLFCAWRRRKRASGVVGQAF